MYKMTIPVCNFCIRNTIHKQIVHSYILHFLITTCKMETGCSNSNNSDNSNNIR